MTFENEIWLPVVGYEGCYEVSDHGRVRSLDRIVIGYRKKHGTYTQITCKGTILKQKRSYARNYPGLKSLMVTLCVKQVQNTVRVHSLVMAAFVGPRPEGYEVAHYDSDPSNNHISNLRYATAKENCSDRIRNGTQPIGEKNPSAVLTDALVLQIREMAGVHTKKELAKQFGVSTRTIHRIVDEMSWKHLL